MKLGKSTALECLEYLKLGKSIALEYLEYYCAGIFDCFRAEFLRRPTIADT
jgi:hypothetical protein